MHRQRERGLQEQVSPSPQALSPAVVFERSAFHVLHALDEQTIFFTYPLLTHVLCASVLAWQALLGDLLRRGGAPAMYMFVVAATLLCLCKGPV